MQAGRRYSLWQTINWQRRYIIGFVLYSSIPVFLHEVFWLELIHIPWQPISLIGIAVAFYLGFKNNSAYERLWEGRKIWGGIVNASRSFTVMARDFINDDATDQDKGKEKLDEIRQRVVYRLVAWLHALAIELRKPKAWEHGNEREDSLREALDTVYKESQFDRIKPYLTDEDFAYVMSKGNKSSHLLSVQSKELMALRRAGVLEHFRHLQMQELITEFYTLQGKSERIKNFPFPRQYTTVNFFFVVMFIILLPFGMMDIFAKMDVNHGPLLWLSIPFSVVCSWVFWMMDRIGDYSENPFEGLYNDVPITSMAIGIERDIRQMLDEDDLPEPMAPLTDMKILV